MSTRGKPESFTDRENASMRHVLKTLMEQRKLTQEQMAKLMGVTQQTVAKLRNVKRPGNFSRPTALRLAELCGFDGPESLLRDLGSAADKATAPQGWAMRDLAVTLARRAGIDDRAIDRVVAKYQESRYATAEPKWWMARFVREDEELAAEKSVVAAPASSPVLEEKPRKRRKGAA